MEKLISEDHPTIEFDRCSNSKQRRKTCTVCKDVCPKGVIECRRDINWDECGNCNVCVSQCPSRAIKSSAINVGKLLEIYKTEGEHVVVACKQREGQADLKLYCVASMPWEVIAYLALEKQVVIQKHDCENCLDKDCLAAFDATMSRVKDFLGEARYNKQVRIIDSPDEGATPAAPLMSRRDMFALFGRRAKTVAGSILPDDGSVRIDGMLYRKLLAKRLRELSKQNAGRVFGWRTLAYNENCWGCGICAKVCPNGAIEVVEDGDGVYMSHSLWNCEGCGICRSVCLEGGLSGVRTEYTVNPLQPVLTKTVGGRCAECGRAVRPGTGAFCYDCAVTRQSGNGHGTLFRIIVPDNRD